MSASQWGRGEEPGALRRILGRRASIAIASALACGAARAQASQHALRFYGTGTAQQDRLAIQVDDDRPGADASAPCDVGAGGFTLELWLRGELADDASANAGGDTSLPATSWRDGNVVLDRGILSGSERWFGVSVAGGFVRFGVGAGDAGGDAGITLEGDTPVLDGNWHHVACVRDAASGTLRIYVDGSLDHESAPDVSTADLSFPNDGLPGGPSLAPYLVVGAEKYDEGPEHPSFHGDVDELRVWSVARTQAQIQASWFLVLPPDSVGLAGAWRMEEGAGTRVEDASAAHSPAGELAAGEPGNGEWLSAALDPSDVAPVIESALPPGFQLETLASGLDRPSALAIAPDGTLLVGELGGAIRLWRDGALLPQPLIEIPANDTGGDSGLLEIELGPDFANDGALYVFYVTFEPRARVARFQVVGDRADLGSEVVIWESTPSLGDAHYGGGLAFGGDGRLFIGTGDQNFADLSQDLGSVWGKLLRLEADGSIPPDNPFLGVPGAEPAVFARGLRNAFRLRVDAEHDDLWIGEVGGNGAYAWEEVDEAQAGANFGWPQQAGPTCYAPSCSAFLGPAWGFEHDDDAYTWHHQQGCLILGPVYRSTAFPPEYRGSMFVGDYANRWIRRLSFDEQHEIVSDEPFLDSPDAGPVVDLRVGPDGALYWVTFGGANGSGGEPPGALLRASYGGAGNFAPIAHAAAAPDEGMPPLDVRFSSAGSFDPDAGPGAMSFHWDFGDGESSDESDPQHTYLQEGLYTATLAVGDGASSSLSDPVELRVGALPVAKILQPLDGATYRAGDSIDFSGSASDASGDLPPSALSWLVMLEHAGHEHPFLGPIEGVSGGSFTVPTSGHPPEDSHLRLVLTATSANGLSAQAEVDLAPVPSVLALRTWPPHVPLFLGGQAEATPRDYVSLVGFEHALEAPRWHPGKGSVWLFERWSDGQPRAHGIVAPEGGLELDALYVRSREFDALGIVTSEARNAQFSLATGQSFQSASDPQTLELGRTAGAPLQTGFEFVLDVPQGALILSAVLELDAAADDASPAVLDLWVYDVGDAPPFEQGASTSLLAWAPRVDAVRWRPVPPFSGGTTLDGPELASLLQVVVDRPDWSAGHAAGIVFDGAPTPGGGKRRVRNFASGSPPRLRVHFAVPAPISGRPMPH